MRVRRGPKRGSRNAGRALAGDPSDPLGFAALVTGYLEGLRVKSFSESTVGTRRGALVLLVEWLDLRGITRPADVTKPVLERYQRHLFQYRQRNGRPLSFLRQKLLLVAVRLFFRWLSRQNLILSNPASDLELPRAERRLPQVLTAEETERVIATVDLLKPMGLRDRAILETLYSTGIRRCELAGVRIFDVDSERKTLVVRQGKGKKDRIIPIGERALHWVGRYLEELRPKLVSIPDEGVLFLSEAGETMLLARLTDLVRRCVKRAELGKTGSCHLFRHTMATLMLENGADIRFIQEMLGHASLASTQIYTHVSIRKLQEVHTATHPAAKLDPPPSAPTPAEASAGATVGEVLTDHVDDD